MIWDELVQEFDQIIDYAAIALGYVGSSYEPHQTQRGPVSFSLGYGVAGILLTSAFRCRHPRVRRKAASLLLSSGIQDGIWNSRLTGHVVAKLIKFEEDAARALGVQKISCPADIPTAARLSHVTALFDLTGESMTVHYRSGQSSRQEVIEFTGYDSQSFVRTH